MLLQPWDSRCLGVYQQVISPAAERTLYEQSMQRLQQSIKVSGPGRLSAFS